MSAIKLNIRGLEPHGAFLPSNLVRQIAPARPMFRCPECHSILYTRRHRLCGVCGQELPTAILFSSEESNRVRGLLESERAKHRAWMQRS